MSDEAPVVPDGEGLEHLVGRARALRHALHRHPEVSGEEERTARRIIEFLEGSGLRPVATQVGGHGLVYRIEGEGEAPGGGEGATRLFRTDIDALPLLEKGHLDHRSENEGVHHGCGHDGHAAMLASALCRLAENPQHWSGTILAVFQPAEETGAGALAMLEDESGPDLSADVAYAFHNLPGFPLGNLVLREGPMACASVGLDMRFQGATAHASEPHEGRNPIPSAATLLLRSLSIPNEVLPMGRPALVTPVALQGGKQAYGTAAGDARLSLTIRADHTDDLDRVVERILDQARVLATDGDFELEADRVEWFPACDNARGPVGAVRQAATTLDLKVTTPSRPRPWSEDFGHFLRRTPGALIGLGAGTEHPDIHTPSYDFPDELLPIGIRLWSALAEQPLPPLEGDA